MKNEAPRFLSALKDASIAKGDRNAFPARQSFLAIRSFMVDNAAVDSAPANFPHDAWSRAVHYAQLREAMILMHSSDDELKVKT